MPKCSGSQACLAKGRLAWPRSALLEFPFCPSPEGPRFSVPCIDAGEKTDYRSQSASKGPLGLKSGSQFLGTGEVTHLSLWGSVRGCSLKTEE